MKTDNSTDDPKQAGNAPAKNSAASRSPKRERAAVHVPPLEEMVFTLKPLSFPQRRSLYFLKNFIKNYKEDIEDNDIFKPLNRAIALDDAQDIFMTHFSKAALVHMRLIEVDDDDECDLGDVEADLDILDLPDDGDKQIHKFAFDLAMKSARRRNRRRAGHVSGGRINHMDSCQELFAYAWLTEVFRPKVANVIRVIAERYEQPEAVQFFPADFTQSRFEEIKKTLSLNDFEVEILQLTYVKERNYLDFPERRGEDAFYAYLKFFSKCLDCPESTLLKALGSRERLRRYGCISCGARILLPGELDAFIDGLTDRPLISRYYRKFDQETLPWGFFESVVKEHGDILKKIISNRKVGQGINILLHGFPGTGKTSFAYALAKELGFTAYTISESVTSRHNLNANATFRYGALQFTADRIDNANSIIVIDEADDMLTGEGSPSFFSGSDEENEPEVGGGRTGKGLLNHVLDNTKCVVIWLANSHRNELDLSNRRRFDYSIEFEGFSAKQRLKIWHNIIGKNDLGELYSDALLDELSTRFAVNAGTVAIVIKNIINIKPEPKDVRDLTIKLLTQQCKLLDVECDSTNKFLPAKDYSLDGLNIKTTRLSLEKIVRAIRGFQESLENRDADGSIDRPRMNILLHGAPGSGKTEFVKYLAKTLNTKVVKKMGSDLLNKYVGGTEQNIAKAFREAEQEKAILFMDEFDGLLQTREKAQHSWETSQVNEILEKMENFDGVFIAATNFTDSLDPAAMRRFTFKVEFDFLDNNGKRIFFKRFFGTDLSEQDGQRLDNIEYLTPGDFRTARQSLYYLGEEVSNADRLDVLARESEEKEKTGFVRKNRHAGFV